MLSGKHGDGTMITIAYSLDGSPLSETAPDSMEALRVARNALAKGVSECVVDDGENPYRIRQHARLSHA